MNLVIIGLSAAGMTWLGVAATAKLPQVGRHRGVPVEAPRWWPYDAVSWRNNLSVIPVGTIGAVVMALAAWTLLGSDFEGDF